MARSIRSKNLASRWNHTHVVAAVVLLVLAVTTGLTIHYLRAATIYTAPIGKRMFGSYVNGTTVTQMEADIGRKLDIYSTFENWQAGFPSYVSTTGKGRITLIAWEPHGIYAQDVIDGRHDAYLRSWATAAKNSGQQVYIRPWPEMNGDWAPWSPFTSGTKYTTSPAQMIQAWRHAHDVFVSVGATNVKWVFNPNETDSPSTAGNKFEVYYPGDAYVDVLSFDAYNWAGYNGIGWRSHIQVFTTPYNRLAALNANYPIWIAEGSASPRVSQTDKANWFKAMFADTGFPRFQAYVLFSINKEQDWRYNSSPEVLNAFKTGLAGPVTPSPSTSPSPTTQPGRPGDFNIDGKVNVTDLSFFLTRWNGSDATADLNHSGKVDITDLSILLSNWLP